VVVVVVVLVIVAVPTAGAVAVVAVNAQRLGVFPFTFWHPNISQLVTGSQNLELGSWGGDCDSLWSYLLCTRHTVGMDRSTAYASGSPNSHGQ
jgi:hypothetical protein